VLPSSGPIHTLSAPPDEAHSAHEPLPAVNGGGTDRPPLAQKVTSAPCPTANGSAWRAGPGASFRRRTRGRGCYHTRTQCRTIAYSVDVITRPHADADARARSHTHTHTHTCTNERTHARTHARARARTHTQTRACVHSHTTNARQQERRFVPMADAAHVRCAMPLHSVVGLLRVY
jgi:hypothetical protein